MNEPGPPARAAIVALFLIALVPRPSPAATAPTSKASATPAAAPAGSPPPATHTPRFEDVAARAGLVLVNVCGEKDKSTIVETVGNGACLDDVDGDGRLDVFLPNGSRVRPFDPGTEPRSALYRSRGDGTYEDITTKAGVALSGYWAQGCAFADYDGDGLVDLLVTGFGRYHLFRNAGGGVFRDATAGSGLSGKDWSTGAAFADYDRDGDVDLYVSHYMNTLPGGALPRPGSASNCFYRGFPVICGPNGLPPSYGRLYRNEGGGKFRDVTRAMGLATTPAGYGLGAVWSDLDDDGDVDLYVANDSTPSLLYRNDGSRFAEIGVIAGVAYNEEGQTQAGMGVDSGDYDGDGLLDLIVTNFSHDYATLRRNEGNLFFRDVSMASGIGAATLPTLGWGTGFLDYDNDGRLDLFIANGHVFTNIDEAKLGTTYRQRNQLFHGEAGGRFRDVSRDSGPAFEAAHSARGSAFGDLDDDGDVDIVVNNMDEAPSLLRNDGGNARAWIGFRLAGAGRNRGALGARVRVTAGGVTQTREVRAGSSHNSSSDKRLHFGLGSARRAERVEIRWPRGGTQVLENLEAGRYHVLAEPVPRGSAAQPPRAGAGRQASAAPGGRRPAAEARRP